MRELAPKVNICPWATVVFAVWKPQQVVFVLFCFPGISARVVFKPRSNLVLRKPLKMSQEGRRSQTVRRLWQAVAQEAGGDWFQGQGLQGALADSHSAVLLAGGTSSWARPRADQLLPAGSAHVICFPGIPADIADGTEGQQKNTCPDTSWGRRRCPATPVLPESGGDSGSTCGPSAEPGTSRCSIKKHMQEGHGLFNPTEFGFGPGLARG